MYPDIMSQLFIDIT